MTELAEIDRRKMACGGVCASCSKEVAGECWLMVSATHTNRVETCRLSQLAKKGIAL